MPIDSRLFSVDHETGIETRFHFDEDTEDFMLEKVFDIEPLLEANQYLANTEEYKVGADMRRVASIPLPVVEELKKIGLWPPSEDNQRQFAKWLNDRDNRVFRVNVEIV